MNYPAYAQAPAQYAQQPQQQYAPQQFMPGVPQPYAAPQPPAPPLAQGSIDDYFDQPSVGGGDSLKFTQVGESYIGIVARAMSNGDIRQQTDSNRNPLAYNDGRPKFVMVVPLAQVARVVNGQPQGFSQDGLGAWWVKGQARDELVRAMAEAGAPQGAPEAGAAVQITFVGERAGRAGFSPSKQFSVVYRRPQGAAPVAAQPAPAPAVTPPVAETAPVVSTSSGQPVVYQQPIAAPPAAQVVQQFAPPAPAVQAPPLAPQVQLDPKQQELLNSMLGN